LCSTVYTRHDGGDGGNENHGGDAGNEKHGDGNPNRQLIPTIRMSNVGPITKAQNSFNPDRISTGHPISESQNNFDPNRICTHPPPPGPQPRPPWMKPVPPFPQELTLKGFAPTPPQ